jgi:hypothetical protein
MKSSDLLADSIGLLGAGLLSYGAWLVYAPAGFIVGGVLLLAAGWMLSGVKPESNPKQEQG